MCTSVSVVQCTMEMKELLTTGVLELNDSLNHPLQVEYNRVPADLACVSRYSLFIKNELKWHLHLHKERKCV